MDRLLDVLLINGLTAAVLAVAVAAASRYIRRPSIVHALWVVVLLKLITPPVFEIGLLPAPEPSPETSSTLLLPAAPASPAAAAAPAPLAEGSNVAPVAVDRSGLVRTGALGVWLAGAWLVLLLALVRASRFQRMLSGASWPTAGLRASAVDLAQRLGLALCPAIRVVPARISPMLWFPFHRLELLFPEALLAKLQPEERDTLLAHELAHVRRGDHWVRYLELAVVALFWWHPVVWWARRRMRQAEERSCDDWVLRALPGHSKAYAGGLVKTVEFLAESTGPVPALASGAADADNLKERLTMILKNAAPKRLTRAQAVLLGIAALALLIVFPTRADRTSDERRPSAETVSEERARALEQQIEDLERELELLHERHRETEMALEEERVAAAMERLQTDVARLQAEGRRGEADRLSSMAEYKQQMMKARQELEMQRMTHRVRSKELEQELMQSLEAAEEHERNNNLQAAEELRARARAIKMQLTDVHRSMERHGVELGREMFDLERRTMMEEIDRLRNEGRDREAQAILMELEYAEQMRALESDRSRRMREIEKLESAGEADAAAREHLIQELLMEVERLRAEQRRDERKEGTAR